MGTASIPDSTGRSPTSKSIPTVSRQPHQLATSRRARARVSTRLSSMEQ